MLSLIIYKGRTFYFISQFVLT